MSSQAERETRRQRRSARRLAAEREAKRRQQKLLFGGAIALAVIVVLALIVVPQLGDDSNAEVQIAEATNADIPTNGRVIGNADAPVTVVEWGDYQCPGCAQFAQDIEPQLIQDYVATGRVKFEFRNLAFIGDESTQAAEAAFCALDQGQFWRYHDTIYLNHNGENQGAYSNSRLKEMAEGIGLNMDEFNACFEGDTHADEVAAMGDEARSLGIQRTPTLMVNDEEVNYTGYGSLRDAIEAKLNS